VVVHSAGIQDRVGARALLIRLFALFSTIGTVFADSGYTGSLIGWAKAMFGWTLTVVKRTEAYKFVVLPKRWIVELPSLGSATRVACPKTTSSDMTLPKQ
jgi:transposase